MPKPEDAESRDQRKELGEGQEKETGSEPKDGEQETGGKSPEDPADRPNPSDQAEPDPGDPRRPNVPAWITSLPPQVRDALVRGDFERVPPEYRERVQEFIRWMLTRERGQDGR